MYIKQSKSMNQNEGPVNFFIFITSFSRGNV